VIVDKGFWRMEARKIVRVARVRPIGLDDHNANCAYFESFKITHY
jgi:hypothetical protein